MIDRIVRKSQLAVEYSYQLRDKSPDTWVFWVHASNRARFEEGYRKIAERTRLPSWDQPNVDILKLVHMWLCTETNGHWVMIIDNADDIDVFPRSTYKDFHNKDNVGNDVVPSLLELLPQSPNGSILITSRNRNVAFRLTGSYSDIIQVQPMNEAQALALLQKKLDGGFKQEDAMALVEALDYMPLAITQAAAYINQRAPRATVPRYLQDLRKGDRNREKLLEIDIEDSRRDGTSSNSILATWQISFEHILRMKPSATRLLSLMSLFDRQGIPESLLDGHYQRDDDDAIFDFEDDLNTLTSYSLVGTDVNGHQFEMHRLVQYSTRKWLDLHGELEGWKETYIKLINNNYPVGQYENRTLCQTLFPHAQATVAYRPAGGSTLESWASVLFKAAWCADDMGNYYIAQELLRGALEAREVTLGVEHPDTLSSVSKLGMALRNGGKYEEAELMVRRALRGREKVLGLEDPLTLSDLNGLGLVLSERGNYEEAEIFHRQALQAQETILGLKHHSTLQSLSDLGVLLTKRGSYEEAESLHRRGLQIEEVVLGVDHEHTLASMDNLGLVLGKQGKFDEAETMHQQALNGSAKRFGEKHPSTLICARNLACVLGFLEKYEDAESMHRRVLDDSVNVLGNDHPFTLYSFCNLGSVLHAQGKDKEAEVMHQQALASREKLLGKEHPHTLSSMHNLATVWKGLRRDQEAVSLMRKCFQLKDEVLGPSHPDTKKSGAILEKWEYESLDAATWKPT
jgi:tetratricopeptide (TPR) repeat protein